jgi:hypothetical protein
MTSLPRGLRWLIGKIQEDLDDQEENFVDFEQGLDWIYGMSKHEVKRQTVERPTRDG